MLPCGCRVEGEDDLFICAAHFQKILSIARKQKRAIDDVIWMIQRGRKK